MTDWQVIWLGTMAVALVVMAVVQVGLIVGAMRLGRELMQTTQELRRDIKPLIEKAQKLSEDAGRAASLAVAQAERVDRLLAMVAVRVDETLTVLQGAIIEPVRQGATLVAAVRAFAAGFRQARDRAQAREEDDALFVG